jgi:hypothetical protein
MHATVRELRYRYMPKVYRLGRSDTRELPGVKNLNIRLIRSSSPVPAKR